MNEIRAFVGHSFTEDDLAVVRSFVDFFNRLSELLPNFSWQHAEPATTKVLAEKVMSLMSDANVFIGICTKKERVVQPGVLETVRFRPGYLKAREESFAWKTSDWIIQEIGIAKGRNLPLILLFEAGLREPGGIQGDVEFIEFDRTAPQKSFQKILEMISSLSPKASRLSAVSSDTSSAPADRQKDPEPPGDDDSMIPKADWTRRNYEFAFWHMIITGNEAGAKSIQQAYIATEEAAQGDNRDSWDAYCEYTRLASGKGGTLEKLKAMAETHQRSSGCLAYLAEGYEHYQDHMKAASVYEAAARETNDEATRLHLLGRASLSYARAEMPASVLETIGKMKTLVETSADRETQLLRVLMELTKIEEDNEAALSIMERIVELDPGDIDMRFSLAHMHSECGNNDLALFHYLRIPSGDRESGTWNNLGVAFDEASMPAKSVQAYRIAEGLGETLAMSNLAQKFMSAGFLPEAQEQCARALAIADYHKNVGHTLAKLKDVPEQEDKKKSALLEKAKPRSDYYKEFGRAVSHREPNEIGEFWEGPDCVLTVRLTGRMFSAEGSYDDRSIGFLSEAFFGTVSGNKPASVRWHVKYTGDLRGRAIEANVTRTRDGESATPTTLLGSKDDKTKVLMIFTDDGAELKVMECPPRSSTRFYTLKLKRVSAK